MIKATELRIGNLIEIKCIAIEVLEDDFEVQECNIHNLVSIHNGSKDFLFRPIPLTEDWLVRFGFKQNSVICKFFEKDDVCVFIEDGNFGIVGYDSEAKRQYVHQLQNLYYALTQQELLLK